MQNNISVIGVGKLGLCLSLNLEQKGFNILGVDKDLAYVNSLNNKTFKTVEPHVNELLLNAKNIKFSTEIKEAINNDIIFIVVPTPSTQDHKYDHSIIDYIANYLKSLGKQNKRKDIIINCTTFPGYCEQLHLQLSELNYHVSYNPEFIAQGSIIRDQLNCDTVLIGQSDEYAGNLIESIYRQMVESKPVFSRLTRTEAELTKLSVNCFLTTKISYANMIGDIANRIGCDPEKVLLAVGADSRIGSKYIKPGFGFGGPCFPRDNRALSKCAEEVGIDAVISKATDVSNERHLTYQVEDFVKQNPDKTKVIDIDFITYKKESTLIEESQQLKFVLKLISLGYKVNILDDRKEVLEKIKHIL